MEVNKIILDGNKTYTEFHYKNEKELELLAVKNKDVLFGKVSIYFDIKKSVTSNANITKIPDGLLLTTNNFQDSKLWLVEYELSHHDLEGHIYPQIMGFINALRNESTKRSIKQMLYTHIKQNPSSVHRIKTIIPNGGEIYHFLENVLERTVGIVVVIDRNIPELEEIVDSIATSMNLQSLALEFITYQGNDGKKIHLLDTMPFTVQPTHPQKREVMVWDTRMERASPNIRTLVVKLISQVKAKLSCVGMTWFKWYGFYLHEPANRKRLFAVIMLGKNTATLCFRVKPEEYKNGKDNVRNVKGFFFPTGTERRIHVEGSSNDKLIDYVSHSYEITKDSL